MLITQAQIMKADVKFFKEGEGEGVSSTFIAIKHMKDDGGMKWPYSLCLPL
jgi:hypothetical protein